MRALVIMFVVSLAVVTVCHALLPAEIATHFGFSGTADSWAPRAFFTGLMAGIDVLMFVIFLLTPQLVVRLPADLVNLPHREYWLSTAHRDQARALLAREMGTFGAVLLGFMSVTALLTLKANLDGSQRLDMPLFAGALGAFLCFTAFWCVHLFRVFRVPAGCGADTPLEPR